MCLPALQKLIVSHNAIQRIQDHKKVLCSNTLNKYLLTLHVGDTPVPDTIDTMATISRSDLLDYKLNPFPKKLLHWSQLTPSLPPFFPHQVLEHVTELNLAHNRLHSLEGLHAFVAMTTLNLSYNLVSSRADLDRLTHLRRLARLTMTGEFTTSGGWVRRAKNKALGLAGQAEILIGHLYNLIQSWSNFGWPL